MTGLSDKDFADAEDSEELSVSLSDDAEDVLVEDSDDLSVGFSGTLAALFRG